jgi:hypothetical protein
VLGSVSTLRYLLGVTDPLARRPLFAWLPVSAVGGGVAARDQPRRWLAVGATAGAGLYNKHLVILLLLTLAGGLLLAGPRRALLSRWLHTSVIGAVFAAWFNRGSP